MKKILLVFAVTVSLQLAAGSDPYFRQAENILRYYNPAYTGLLDAKNKSLLLSFRNQWMDFRDGAPMTFSTTFGGYFEKLKGAVDGTYMFDRNGVYQNHWLSMKYAFNARLGEHMNLNIGGRASLALINADFGPCITAPNYVCEIEGVHKAAIPDFDAGLMLTHTDKFFLGLSARHLTEPEAKMTSLQGTEKNLNKEYLTYYALMGTTLRVGDHGTFTASGNYRHSGNDGVGEVIADFRWRFIRAGAYCIIDKWDNVANPYGFTIGFSKKEGRLHLLTGFEPSYSQGSSTSFEAGAKYIFGKLKD